MTTEQRNALITEILGKRCEPPHPRCMTCVAWAMVDEIERLGTYVEDILTKDRLKTREINLLTPENRKLRAALEPARNWFSSVEDTRGTQAAIDKFRDAARSALDVPDVTGAK